MIDDISAQTFGTALRNYYRAHGRHDLPWRLPGADGHFDPYAIMVSEIMLQQTQVARVIPKYRQFLERFPAPAVLAAAPPGDVLRVWNGLGYNRRAKFLHLAARRIVSDYGGQLPDSAAELAKLPGIGANTAGAILAYAFGRRTVFVETNIRTVFIHHFFHDRTGIPDRQILELVERTLPSREGQPIRQWYWALMDYGVHLKQTVGNLNRRSRTYARQSRFEGSRRQIRGQIIRLLSTGSRTVPELQRHIKDERLAAVLQELRNEHLISKRGLRFSL